VSKTALGHIFPGLAVAAALRDAGWRVFWLGSSGTAAAPSMESHLVPAKGFEFNAVEFSGVRGKGLATLAGLPLRLVRACWQSLRVIRRVNPDVVVGFGGFITVPAGIVSILLRKFLILHEQNSVAGMANRQLGRFANRVYTAFPDVLKQASWIGNPLRKEFLRLPDPSSRFAARQGPLRILVLGGSLGAAALNEVVPKALAMLPLEARPVVTHQSGQKQIEQLRANYQNAGVAAELTPFVQDTAQAMAQADLVICRAGASTVTELAAVGAAAVLVPFPSAVDDHQTTNAKFLSDNSGGWLVQQADLTPDRLAHMLTTVDRSVLLAAAKSAHRMAKPGATEHIVAACESWALQGKAA
jgi:UDP-N-acetylglucosamine--N-acetylmuramyl-(pentapeptide) pyrophosphoryl-undecaprenol N-acetylglucosamine transferase